MKYDIFLGGPWEKYAPFPYKTIIKKAFPGKAIFDPEEREAQKTGEWFLDDMEGLLASRSMVALVPEFPFSGVCPEVGIFYIKNSRKRGEPLENIVIIWPKIVKPDYAKKVARKYGYLVETPDEAIARLKPLLG